MILALALLASIHVDPSYPHIYHEPPEMVVNEINCAEWERTDAGSWLTESGARVVAESGPVALPVGTEATQKYAEDLWLTVELMCNPYYGEGIWDDA